MVQLNLFEEQPKVKGVLPDGIMLRHHYEVGKLSQWQIGEIYGVSQKVVCEAMAKAGIKCHRGRPTEMLGRRFGKVVVLERAPDIDPGVACWKIRCDCGIEKVVRGTNLRQQMARV